MHGVSQVSSNRNAAIDAGAPGEPSAPTEAVREPSLVERAGRIGPESLLRILPYRRAGGLVFG